MLRLKTCLVGAIAAVLLAGCFGTSPPTRYYLMHPIAVDGSVQTAAEFETDLILGIGPVVLPDYLERQQIVTRNSANVVRLAEFDRWAEPLRQNFTRVLKENLSTLLGTDYILLEPWPKAAVVEYRLIVDVIHFEVDRQNAATLDARWLLMRETDDVILMIRKSTHTAAVGGAGYDQIAAALNQTLADFSRETAGKIQQIYLKEHGR
jgi:uncharacterized lipoprotein YmbA